MSKARPSKKSLHKHSDEMYDHLNEAYKALITRGYFGVAYDIENLLRKIDGKTVDTKRIPSFDDGHHTV